MKIKSLLLGSIAAAGLSTGAYAADLSVLTSLDACDDLGISGLTVSSDDNCLAITGEVSYEFRWGDYNGTPAGWPAAAATNFAAYDEGYSPDAAGGVAPDEHDWYSKVEAFIKFEATSSSDFGPAKAVLKLKVKDENKWMDEVQTATGDLDFFADEAYVQIGDGTYLMAGKKGSIIKKGNDEPFNFLGLYNSEKADKGVLWNKVSVPVADGGHVIQVTSVIGEGVSVGAGLENLQGDGTFVAFIEYAGDMLAAHATVIATDVLLGAVTNWAYHAGATVTVDQFKFRAAVAGDDTGWWNALASAEATFDMFKLAGSVEWTTGDAADPGDELGFGVSAGADVTDTVTINAGFRWWDTDTGTADTEIWQAALQLVAAVTETVTLTGEIGVHGENFATDTTVTYGAAELAWAPGGGTFTSSVKAEANSASAYKLTFKAKKTFQ